MVRTEDIFEAYYLCRKKKRRAKDALGFEVGFEDGLIELCDEINEQRYIPGTAKAFVVDKPVHREVFAPAFKDRIVDTYISMRLNPLLERAFTDRTFNCRVGKGALYGVKMLYNDIKECSHGFTEDCYVLHGDIKGFFMSIPKELLRKRLDDFIVENYFGDDKDSLRYITGITITHHPEADFIRKSPKSKWRFIPKNKSLITNDPNRGLAIGRITSQIGANFFLNDFDHWVIEELGFCFYGRYVDDFYIVYKDKVKLLSVLPKIREKLKSDFGLTLHPNKLYIQHYSKGMKFTGAVVKPGRIYISNRTVSGLYKSIHRFNKEVKCGNITPEKLESIVSSLNSYLGLMRHTSSYALRRSCTAMLLPECWEYVYIKGRFYSFAIKKKYRIDIMINKRLRNGKKDRLRFD